jgi:hypothetical protein
MLNERPRRSLEVLRGVASKFFGRHASWLATLTVTNLNEVAYNLIFRPKRAR